MFLFYGSLPLNPISLQVTNWSDPFRFNFTPQISFMNSHSKFLINSYNRPGLESLPKLRELVDRDFEVTLKTLERFFE